MKPYGDIRTSFVQYVGPLRPTEGAHGKTPYYGVFRRLANLRENQRHAYKLNQIASGLLTEQEAEDLMRGRFQ